MLITYAIPFFSEKDKHQNQNETGNFDKSWNHCKPRPTTMTAQVSKKGLIRHFKKEETGRVDFRKDFWGLLGTEKNWPIADRPVPSNDPINNCGHISAPVALSFLKG